jgi:hypothetical protein
MRRLEAFVPSVASDKTRSAFPVAQAEHGNFVALDRYSDPAATMSERLLNTLFRPTLVTLVALCAISVQGQGIFFSADFNDGNWPSAFDLGAAVEQQTPEGEGTGEFVPAWRIGTATEANAGGFFEVPNMPIGNRFAMSNDDAEPCNCDLQNVSLTFTAPSFVGRSGIALECRVFHDQALGGGDAFIEVSYLGGSWTQLATVPVDGHEWQPLLVNLSAYDGFDNIRIRFRWSDNGQWASGFAVDDIVLRERGAVDLSVEEVFTYDPTADPFTLGDQALRYTLLPLEQVAPMHVAAEVMNRGTQALTGFSVSASLALNGTVQVTRDSTLATTLLPGERTVVLLPMEWAPTSIGQVVATISFSTIAPDEDPSNNAGTADLRITGPGWDGRYGAMARDNGQLQGTMGGAFPFIALTRLEMANSGSTARGVSAYITSNSAVGEEMRAILFNSDFAFVDSSARHVLTQEDLDRAWVGESLYLSFAEQVVLSAGDYFAGMQHLDGDGEVFIGLSGNTPIGASVLMQGPTFVVDYLRTAPMVRLHLDGFGVGIDELGSTQNGSLSVYPVPLNGAGTVRFELSKTSSVALRVLDMSGRVVWLEELGHLPQGQHTAGLTTHGLADGLYTVEVRSATERLLSKVVVAH